MAILLSSADWFSKQILHSTISESAASATSSSPPSQPKAIPKAPLNNSLKRRDKSSCSSLLKHATNLGADESRLFLSSIDSSISASQARDEISLQSSSLSQLKELLKQRGLKISGNKFELVKRLLSKSEDTSVDAKKIKVDRKDDVSSSQTSSGSSHVVAMAIEDDKTS